MPRTTESPEGKILRYFREAPPAITTLLLGLIQDQVKRQGASAPTPAAPKPPKAKAPAKPSTPPKQGAKPKQGPPPLKKSHHKKKATNAGTGKQQQTNEAEVESFSLPERD